MQINWWILGFCAVLTAVAYWVGMLVGAKSQRQLWRKQFREASRYRMAVADLDRWCGYSSPHARLIAAHLKAHGEGVAPINAGTPNKDEPCTINGLRTQLERLK